MIVRIPEEYHRSYNILVKLLPKEGYSLGKNISLQEAAEIQHVAIHGLRAAFGWLDGTWDKEKYSLLMQQESRRITKEMSWEGYKRISRSGSQFLLDRKTRATVYAAIVTTRILAEGSIGASVEAPLTTLDCQMLQRSPGWAQQ